MKKYEEKDLTPWECDDPPTDGVWQRRFETGLRYAKFYKGLWYASSASIELAATEQYVANQLLKHKFPWRGLKNKP